MASGMQDKADVEDIEQILMAGGLFDDANGLFYGGRVRREAEKEEEVKDE